MFIQDSASNAKHEKKKEKKALSLALKIIK